MLARRKAILDQAEQEQREQLLSQINQLERVGDWSQARNIRVNLLTNLRRRLEEADPV